MFGITVTYSLQQYLQNTVDMPLQSNDGGQWGGEVKL
jgi:hypothetical protein